MLHHDCAPEHKAQSIMAWLDEFGVEEFDWPAQSSDFNPTEHIRDELDQRLRARPSTSVSHRNTPKPCRKPRQPQGGVPTPC